MNVNLPTPGASYSPGLLAALFRSIQTAFGRTLATDEPTSSIILKAANGNNYRVTVSNTGTLTTTLI